VRDTRNLAIAFADIASSARLYRELGDAAASELSRGFTARARALVPQYDGRLVKTLGDGVMCAFANPEQAVLAMGALHAGIAGAPAAEGGSLRLHTGISYGPVIVDGDDVYGTVVNVAAYLAATARAEQILATQAVVDGLSVATAVLARAAYTTRLKGDERDSTVYEIVWQEDPGEITTRTLVRRKEGATDEGALVLSAACGTITVDRVRPRVQLGRDAGNDLAVADLLVSRQHAMIELDGTRVRLVDQSANGTYVAFDGSTEEIHLVCGETLLHGSGRISLGRPLNDPLAQPIIFRRDRRTLYRV
jgi:adenylate cyclase